MFDNYAGRDFEWRGLGFKWSALSNSWWSTDNRYHVSPVSFGDSIIAKLSNLSGYVYTFVGYPGDSPCEALDNLYESIVEVSGSIYDNPRGFFNVR